MLARALALVSVAPRRRLRIMARSMELYVSQGGPSPVCVSTPWAGAPSGCPGELSGVGGGSFLSSGSLVVWRVAGRVLTLCEETLVAPELEGHCVCLGLASEVCGGGDGACRVFRPSGSRERTVVAVATTGHVHVLSFGGARGRVLERA